MQPNQEPKNTGDLSAMIQQQIGPFLEAQDAFKQWREKYTELQNRAADQTALAEAADAEATQHQEALRAMTRDLVRDDTGDREALTALAGKQETARSLAAEHRAFAADLLAKAEGMKPEGMLAAKGYCDTRKKAIGDYAESMFESIMSGIEEQLIQAVSLKTWAYKLENNPDEGNPMHIAIGDIGKFLKNKIASRPLKEEGDPVTQILSKRPEVNPFTMAKINSPIAISKASALLADNSMQ